MAKYETHPINFYSNLADWLFNHSSSKMPAAQWLGTMNALKNTSQDEVESLGLTDYLNSVTPETKVFKSDLCALVQQQLDYPMRLELLTRKLSKYSPEFKIERFSQELIPKKVRKLLVHTMVLDCFKFSSFNYRIIKYRFDGGWFGSIDTCIVLDNKWEVLRPKRSYTMLEAVDMIYMLMTEKFKDFVSTGDDTRYEGYATLGVDNRYQEWLLTLPYWHDAFDNGHFEINNVLLHIRTSQWRDEQGEELLLVDELQSDWHAQGRDYGYYSTYEEPDDNRVPQVSYAKEWALLGVRVALAIAVQKGLNRLAFVNSQVQAERYGDLLDGFVQLYDKQIPDYLNKLAKQFTCGFSQAIIMVSKPRHNIRYINRRTIELQPRYQSASTHYVLSYPVAMFYLKKTGNKVKRELKVFEISPALRDSIKQHGLPMFGNFKTA
ncbi:MAG: hypothetical protein HOP21_00055 [Methylotenera sp.]|nr:hypothetical protein [Methylotenera sp.]